MGLCTSDPLAGTYINASDEVVTDNTIDESTCTPSFKNDNGFEVDLAGGASQALTGTNFRPPVGTYPSAYIKIKNQFGPKLIFDFYICTWISSNGGSKVCAS